MFGFGNAYIPSDSLRNVENVNFARYSAPIVTRTTTSCFSDWLSPYAAACEEVYENCELRISFFLLLFVHKTGVYENGKKILSLNAGERERKRKRERQRNGNSRFETLTMEFLKFNVVFYVGKFKR